MWGKLKNSRQNAEVEVPMIGGAENGSTFTRYSRKKVEEKQFKIKLDTREIVWTRSNAQKTVDSGE